MIKVKIGASEKRFESIRFLDEEWINRNINGLRRDGVPVCVRISIKEGPVNMSLATPNCQDSGPAGRPPNGEERKVFELWDDLGLSRHDCEAGKIVAFLKQIRKLID